MKLGVFASTFAGSTPLEVLSAAQQAGYEAVQYTMTCSGLAALPLAISDEAAEAVYAASIETGVAIAALSATYNMIDPNLSKREEGRRSFAVIAASARRMGANLLTVCTGSRDPHNQWRYHPDNSGDEAWQEMSKEFQLLLPIAEKHDVMLGIEPELGNVVSSAQRARKLIDTLGSERIRIVLDAANLFEIESAERQKMLIEEAIALLKDRISLAHAKDRLHDGRFATAGTGVLDYRHYLTVLQQSGFRGALITHSLKADEAERVAAFLKAELAAAEISA
jgi:sugar phosphate isomerase/epimerase